MNVDAFTISALVDEFMDLLVGGRVQDVIDVEKTALGLEIYSNRRRHYLYMSADKQTPRVHLVGDKLRRGVQQKTQLGLLFRRYIEGGRVAHISQPPYERVMQIAIEHVEHGLSSIIIEPMARRSNLLLVRDGVIQDCMVRVGPDENRYRVSLPNYEYHLPPPMTGRLDPAVATLTNLEDRFDEAGDDPKNKAYRFLTGNFLGVGPLLAREIVFRSAGDINAKLQEIDATALFDALQSVVGPLVKREWQPGIAGDETVPDAFSVYPLTYIDNWRPVETISGAMTAYYGAVVGPDAYNEAKKPVQAAIDEGKAKVQAKIASMERGLKDESEREHLQQSGELILAYQYGIEPGQSELVAQYDPDGDPLHIALDPDLSPVENAQRYFDKYNRAKRAQAAVPQMIEEARTEMRYLQQLETDLDNASNWPEIDDVIQALQSRGYTMPGKPVRRVGGGGQSGPMRFTVDGYVIWIGRNSRQNEQVTFKKANAQDLWLHARDLPGAHAVIRNDGRRIPESLIESVAAVAAHYSSGRNENNVRVDVTRIKYVKAIKGAGPGMVTYRNEYTILVSPQSEEILQDGT